MRLRNMLTTSQVTSAKLKIFISLKMPQITYCHTVCHFCRASDSRKMERVQERALRAVYCDRRSSYDELLRKAKLTALGCRRLQDIAIIMYKAKYNICPPYKTFLSSINLAMGSEILGTFLFLDTTQQVKLSYGLRYVGPVIWSKLNKDVRNAESIYTALKRKFVR